LSRDAQGLQTSVPFEFNNLVVGTRPPVVRIIVTPQVFCGEIVGENRSQSISEGSLLKLGVADHARVVNDGTGLSGRVHAGAKGISVHFRYRYRFEGESRELPLGAWPRVTLAAIWLKLDETKLRIERGGDPAGQRKLVADKLKVQKAQVVWQQQKLAEREREHAESRLTVKAMFEAWHPEATVDNTPRGHIGFAV
jgi:hypothetical protein